MKKAIYIAGGIAAVIGVYALYKRSSGDAKPTDQSKPADQTPQRTASQNVQQSLREGRVHLSGLGTFQKSIFR
jgi:hypothetical protein